MCCQPTELEPAHLAVQNFSLLLVLPPTWGLSPTSSIICFCPDFIRLCITSLTLAAASSSYKILSPFARHLIKEGSSNVSEIKWNFKPKQIRVLLQRECNKSELSKEATFLIYSDEWCEHRGFDAEVPVCSSLFRRDSSPICTSADLFFFLHKPNNLFLCKAVHPFEIFHRSQAPEVTLFYGAAATFAPSVILMNLCHSHQQLWDSTEGGHLFSSGASVNVVTPDMYHCTFKELFPSHGEELRTLFYWLFTPCWVANQQNHLSIHSRLPPTLLMLTAVSLEKGKNN